MNIPKGLNYFSQEEELHEKFCKINKTIYGLVQASAEFYKVLRNYFINELRFEICKSDPCLLKRKDDGKTVMILIYVDDCEIIGHSSATEKLINELKKSKFHIKIMGKMNKYIGCDFIKTQGGIKVLPVKLIEKLYKYFKHHIDVLPNRQTPMGLGNKII